LLCIIVIFGVGCCAWFNRSNNWSDCSCGDAVVKSSECTLDVEVEFFFRRRARWTGVAVSKINFGIPDELYLLTLFSLSNIVVYFVNYVGNSSCRGVLRWIAMRSQRRTSSNRMLNLEKMNLIIYEIMREENGWRREEVD
jgi:hypothetical protein